MHDFRRLQVWHKARALVVAVDGFTRTFPRRGGSVLARQLQRAVLSVPSNIAEGCGKSSRKDTIRYLQMSLASATETENHLLIASDLGYITPLAREKHVDTIRSIQRMLVALMNKLPDDPV
jgi:four helix bundle protein